MKTALLNVFFAALLICAAGTSTAVQAESAVSGSEAEAENLAPFWTVHRMELNADPEESSTEARWKREEILRKKRGITGAGGDVSDYVAFVTVPILVLILLLALLRLPEC